MLLFGDVGQQLDIQDVNRDLNRIVDEINRLDGVSSDVKQSLKRLSRENLQLRLYVAAISRILVAKGLVTSVELADLVDKLDASDGQPDGGYSGRMEP